MLLAIATGDDAKCKVIQFGDDFLADLAPLHQRVLRERFDAKKLMSDEATRLAGWVQASIVQSPSVVRSDDNCEAMEDRC
jgi:hypothetical protein